MFIDIKGAFDCVSLSQMIETLLELRMPMSLIKWVICFMSKRTIQLHFDGMKQDITDIEIGVPQGSPVSPILFAIFIKFLFIDRQMAITVRTPSYVDDLGLVVSSESIVNNCNLIEQAATEMIEKAKSKNIVFDMDKTELIHFYPNFREKNCEVKLLNHSVKPKNSIRWLGIWLDSQLNFKSHVQMKTASAERILNSIIRLSNTERGLSFQAMRQLYIACITSVSDFAVQVWWKNQKYFIERFQKLQNLALKKILGVFKTSPVRAMEIEASLPPPQVRFDKICMNYALRIIKLYSNHSIRKRVSSSFPSESTGLELDWNLYFDWNEIDLAQNSNSLQRKKIPSQLFRICSMIKDNFSSLNIEKINFEKLSPWKKSLDNFIDLKISHLSKEDQTREHLDLLKQMKDKAVFIYTDGSRCEKTGNLGAGIAYSENNSDYLFDSWQIGKESEVFDAELFAILRAFKLIEMKIEHWKRFEHIWVFSDSQAGLKRLQSNKISSGQSTLELILKSLQNIQKKISSSCSIHLHWVSAHMNIYGNEIADKAAKKATELEICFQKIVSWSFIKRKIRESCLQKWQDIWFLQRKSIHYSRFETKPKWKTCSIKCKKKLFATIMQLKLGHGYFKSYLTRFRDDLNDLCSNCQLYENPEHLLLLCTKYTELRLRLREKFELEQLNLKLLFNTKAGNKFLIEYLKESNIATRFQLNSSDL
ncbi:hypothetical protein KLO70_19365, partial [Clostridioides difficile]|nr:hypothetical protein [Clostridioides difficile]